jgi:hypothetical protein
MAKRIPSNLYGGADERYYEASGRIKDKLPGQRWVGIRIKYTDFSAAGLTEEINLATIPAGTVVHALEVDVVEEFSAAVALTAATLEVGDTVLNDPDGLLVGLAGLDETSGPTTGLQQIDPVEYGAYLYEATKKTLNHFPYEAADVLSATLTVVGDNLSDMTGGEVIVYLLVSNVEAAKVFNAGDSAILDS